MDFAKEIKMKCGDKFTLLSGDDGTYDQFVSAGGDGVISVASHVIPRAMIQKQIYQYSKLIDHLFIEANPIPVKAALKMMGIIESDELRLPLAILDGAKREALKEELIKKGLVK
jgi:4-hydroxy-tetrahydrodipicolinate synthase